MSRKRVVIASRKLPKGHGIVKCAACPDPAVLYYPDTGTNYCKKCHDSNEKITLEVNAMFFGG